MHAGAQHTSCWTALERAVDIIRMVEDISNNGFCNGPVDANTNVVYMVFQECIKPIKNDWSIVEELLIAVMA
jgi:hypothetical protein